MKPQLSTWITLVGLSASPSIQAEELQEASPRQIAQQRAERAKLEEKRAEEAGDHLAAERLADVVERWTRVASAWLEAARRAQQAAEIEEQTLALETQTRRARTLVEQTEARRARALGELRRLGVEPVTPTAPDPQPKSQTTPKKETSPVEGAETTPANASN